MVAEPATARFLERSVSGVMGSLNAYARGFGFVAADRVVLDPDD